MNIILLGAPGSGKGTLSEKIIDKTVLKQLSTGDLFRENIAKETELGLEAKKYMNEGKYVPDEITNGMVKSYLKNNSTNQIFDGYPRTVKQSEALDDMLLEINSKIDKVFLLDVNEEVLFSRLTGRLVCPSCKRSYHKLNRKPTIEWVCDFDNTELVTRPDDAPEKINVRIAEYKTLTEPLIDYYDNQKKLVRIVCDNLSGDEVFAKIEKELI